MGEKLKWITHEDKRILYVDFTDMSEEEYMTTIDQLEKKVLSQPLDSVLGIAVIRSGKLTEGIRKRTKVYQKKVKPHVKAIAAVGLSGPIKLLVKLIYRDLFYTDSIEEAKKWLIKQ